MKYLFILLLTTCFFACTPKINPGKYVFEGNRSYITTDGRGDYFFSTNGDLSQRYMFSKGTIKLTGDVASFIPDSSCFFHISVSEYSFDPSLKDNRKIALVCPDSVLNEFHFSIDKYSSDSTIDLKNNSTIVYKPKLDYRHGYLTLRASFRDTTVILPLPLHDYLTSNTIEFSDINNDDPKDKPWNVLKLKLSIERHMFAFTTLSPYLFKHHQFIKKDWPIYKLVK